MSKDKKLKEMNNARVETYRDSQLLLGRDRKEYYVTPTEHKHLRKYLNELREK